MRWLWLVACLLGASAWAEEEARHLGVASCASSVCHGRSLPAIRGNVSQNEYVVWSQRDKHAKAYALLFEPRSREMAARLGLPNAHEQKICLDCHAEHPPPAARGEQFQLDDGVACEACHGASERWIASHVGASHQENLRLGMTALEQPVERAGVCLDCHLGTGDRFAGHRLMAAGHPRLSFELDTFSVLMPMHWRVDDDYRQRKPAPAGGVPTWLQGQAAAARRYLELLQGPRFQQSGVMPELAFFDCHACHHGMSDRRGGQLERGLDPGAVRLNDAHLQLLVLAVRVVAPDSGERLQRLIQELHQASTRERAAVAKAAERFMPLLATLEQRFAVEAASGPAVAERLAAELRDAGRQGRFRDYVVAEQAVMALEMLAQTLGEEHYRRAKPSLDELFRLTAKEDDFRPEDLARAFARLP